MNHERIGAAVEECLQHCRGSFYPLGEVTDFLSKLEADATWSRYDIDAVELRVHRMLSAIVSVSPAWTKSHPTP
jgi:hypothetical protein